MRRILSSLLVFGLIATPALADVRCNEHGAVVTVESGEVYYLGNSCDAAKGGGGEGRWWLTASAVAVKINGTVEALIRFEIDCELPACWAG